MKALFIVQSAAQAGMFKLITQQLTDCNILAVNVQRWQHRSIVEQTLEGLKFPYKTISILNQSNIEKTLNETNPGIVIVGNDDSPESRIIIESANKINIPTLLVQDGILNRTIGNKQRMNIGLFMKYLANLPFRLLRFMLNRKYPLNEKVEIILFELRYGARWKKDHTGMFPGTGECSKMAVFGDSTKEMFISEGVNPERIIVTGNPKFDAMYDYSLDSCKSKVCQRWGISSNKSIIVLLTQFFVEVNWWTSEQRKQFVMNIASATASLPDTQLIIKIHPTLENIENYKDITKTLNPSPIVCSNTSLPELLNACSLAITVSSTAALEAMAIKKPLVIVNLFNDLTSVFDGSGALFATQKDEILPAIKRALYDPITIKNMSDSFNKFIYEKAYLQDGHASRRIADLIRSMAI